MTWVYALFVALVVVNAVVSTAHVWVPVLLGLIGLGLAWRCLRARSRRRTADTSGQRPDATPDNADGESP